MKDIKKYEAPDFDVTVYEVDDVITASSPIISDQDPDGGDWWG